MRFVLPDVLTSHEHVIELGFQSLFGVAALYHLERVDNDQAVPKAGVDMLFRQTAFQLQQHLGSVDNVHLD